MAEGNGELLDDINQKADDRGDGERTEATSTPGGIFGSHKKARHFLPLWQTFV